MTADTSTSPRAESEAHQPTVGPEPMPADVVATSSAEEQTAAAELSNVPNSAGQPNTAVANVSELPVAKPVLHLTGDTEVFRVSKEFKGLKQPLIEVEAGSEDSLEQILERSRAIRVAFRETAHPTGLDSYGTTAELFNRVKTTIAEQASLSEESSATLAYWVFSTWLADAVPFAPCLVISGSVYEGDLVLQTLKNLCRNPFLMFGVNSARLENIP